MHRWREAGLLDDDTHARILAWEALQARPVWLWAFAGVGGFAVALGVAAVVAANWEAIPGGIKVAVHLALDAAVAGALFLAWRAERHRARELLALVLFGLVLSGIGLIGQVYQLGGTAWQALLTWMLVCTPFLALLTRSGLLALVWVLGAAASYIVAVPDLADALPRELGEPGTPGLALAWVPAVALLALGVLRGLQPGRQAQGAWIEGLACLALLAVASSPPLLLRLASDASGLAWGRGWSLAATLAVLLLLALDRRHGHRRLVLVALPLAGWTTWWLTALAWAALAPGQRHGLVSGSDDAAQLAVALVFIAFWALVSWLALRSGHRGVFAAAFAVIALRVFLLYWEALGSLLSTGLGLILGGLLCLALAALGWRIVRHAAPPVAP